MLPEVDLSVGSRVVSRLQRGLWILLEDILDLSCPCDDRTFKDVSFVLVTLVIISGDV